MRTLTGYGRAQPTTPELPSVTAFIGWALRTTGIGSAGRGLSKVRSRAPGQGQCA
jgi:hypothetical protein